MIYNQSKKIYFHVPCTVSLTALQTYSFSLYLWNRKIADLDRRWLPDVDKLPENKHMTKNLIEWQLICLVQIPQGFVEDSFERLWNSYLEHMLRLSSLLTFSENYERTEEIERARFNSKKCPAQMWQHERTPTPAAQSNPTQSSTVRQSTLQYL